MYYISILGCVSKYLGMLSHYHPMRDHQKTLAIKFVVGALPFDGSSLPRKRET